MTDHDEFLNGFRTTPRREFTERLYAKLSDEKEQKSMVATFNPMMRRAALVFAALVLVIATVLVISPAARAAAGSWLEQTMGSIQIVQLADDDYPGDGAPITVPSETVTLAEAQQILPFSMPTSLPVGYEMSDDCAASVTRFPLEDGTTITQISLCWEKQVNGYEANISLKVDDGEDDGLIVGESSGAQEVTFNGKTGVVFSGSWNADSQQYEAANLISLAWVDGDLKYVLSGVPSQGVTEADLISIAASME